MKTATGLLIPLLAAIVSTATPLQDSYGLQTVLSGVAEQSHFYQDEFGKIIGNAEHVFDESRKLFSEITDDFKRWIHDGREYIRQNDQICLFCLLLVISIPLLIIISLTIR